jgi:hypothetical protein
MRDERLESVTFVPAKGYVASAPELRQPVTALSLGGLRRRVEALMLPDDVHIVLHLDRAARLERDRRRAAEQADERAAFHVEHGSFLCTAITRSHGLHEGASGVEP